MMVIKGGDSEQRHKSPTRRSPGKHPQAGQHHMEEASRHTEGRRVWQGTWMWSEGLRWWDLSFFSTPRSVILPGGREALYNIEPGLGHLPHYNTLLTHALSHCKRRFRIFKRLHGYFLGSPVIRTLYFHCKGLGIGSQSGNYQKGNKIYIYIK